MNTASKQSGFAIIEIVIIAVLVIGVLGFIGWNYFNQPAKKTANATTYNTSSTQPGKASTTATSPTPATTVLDLKELGYKITIDDSIKDATYTIVNGEDGSHGAYISTQSLTNQSNGNCSAANGGFASITVGSGTPQQVFGAGASAHPVDNTTTFKFGTDTYVFIARPQFICAQNSTVSNLYSQQQATFFNDFKSLQPDN